MKEKLYNLYVTKRMSISEVAEELGVSSSTAFRWLKKWDIPRRKGATLGKHWKLSEEAKRNMGRKKGFKHTEETKRKMSKTRTGKHHSEETKRKMSEVKNGHKLSEETKKKISEAKKGTKSWNRGVPMTEEQKKKISEAHRGKGHPQSEETKKKLSEALKGEKCYNWKGGITSKNGKIRKSIELRLWREAVFARDNWICQKTRQKGGKLQAHHIQDFSTHPELRTSIENGITLSEEAHRKFHHKYGRNNNTKEQLEEYLS